LGDEGSTLRVSACAKVNLSLEVLGRRADGFHEVISVTQTISLADEVVVSPSGALQLRMEPPVVDERDNLIRRAAEALAAANGRAPTGRLRADKRIPLAAGLGGGSSDAAATLRLLDRLWGIRMQQRNLSDLAAALGSDVPLFLRGGASLIRGRGEIVEPLPPPRTFWLLLVCPAERPPDKTRTLYRALRPDEWSDGAATLALAERLRAGQPVVGTTLVNGFDGAAERAYPDFAALRARLADATGAPFHLTGAGPGLFALFETDALAREAARRLGRPGGEVFVARSIARRPAIRVSRAAPGRSRVREPTR
jgi:4-diphosphocytidyl-2-C-methyl-D-erythritol kinase